jgi:hypothetical protein
MKNNLLILFFLLAFNASAFAQNSGKQADERAVQELIQRSFDSLFSAHRDDQVEEFYTSDFLLLEQGEVWTLETVKNYLAKAKSRPNPVVRVNRFEFIKTEVFGNRAWIAYHNWASISAEGQVSREIYWLESASAIKTESGWRLELLHSTRVDAKK